MLMESIWFPPLLPPLTPRLLPHSVSPVSVSPDRTGPDGPCPLFQAWLRSFGYLPKASRQMSSMRSARMLPEAVGRMQRFYGLEVTGELDAATIA